MSGQEHGHEPAPWRYQRGCRHPVCRELHARALRAMKWDRYAKRVEIDGRLVAVEPGLPHGTQGTYNNWGCRCVACVAAARDTSARYRSRRRGMA